MGTPNGQHGRTPRYGEANMIAAIMRLEQQVSFDHNTIQCLHREIQQISVTVSRLQHDMENVVAFTTRMRDDLRLGRYLSRAMDQGSHDTTDVEILAKQIAHVTTKVNWVDSLETKLQLTIQRLKRLETQIAIDAPDPLLSGTASRAEQQHYEAVRAQQKQQASSHRVAPMHPGAALPFEHGHPLAGLPESRSTPSFHPGQERRLSSSEQVQQDPRQPGFRAIVLHPPPPGAAAALPGWRSAEPYPPSGRAPLPSHNDLRSHPPGSDSQVRGWAAVDFGQASKHPFGEHQPQHNSDQHGSPKRRKLTTLPPLKPRSNFDHDYDQCPYLRQAQMDPARQARVRVSPEENPIQPQTHLAPSQEAPNSHHLATSTGQPDSQETRRATNDDPAIDVLSERSTAGAAGRERGHGNGGESRGDRGRGGTGSSGLATISQPASGTPTQGHLHKQVLLQPGQHQLAAAQQATTDEHYPKRPAGDTAADEGSATSTTSNSSTSPKS